MPRPLPSPIRQAMFRLFQQGLTVPEIVERLGIPSSTAYRLIQRFRRDGSAGIPPSYRPPPEAIPPAPVQAAIDLRREHPTWGAELIRVRLQGQDANLTMPSGRALRRWLKRAGLSPAPPGRPRRADKARATEPHDTWQMDAKEHIKLKNNHEVSWLRVVDECSGAVVHTTVFPPGGLGPGPSRCGPRAA